MVSALDSGGPGSSPGRGTAHVVFLGEILYSHSASLHPTNYAPPKCINGYRQITTGGNYAMD